MVSSSTNNNWTILHKITSKVRSGDGAQKAERARGKYENMYDNNRFLVPFFSDFLARFASYAVNP